MGTGMAAKGYKLTENRAKILRLLHAGPVVDDRGRAVRVLMASTGHRTTQALAPVLEAMERDGLIRRTMTARRTYRSEAVPDALTETDRRRLEIPASGPTTAAQIAAGRPASRRASIRLTAPRVSVLRALLASGPIEDLEGRATRLLMARIGRTDPVATNQLLASMENAGLVHRHVVGKRTYRIEGLPDALTPADLRLVWSTTRFPLETLAPSTRTTATEASQFHRLQAELDATRAELAATRDELARVRLQWEVFRAWARRMPTLEYPPVAAPAGDGPSPASLSAGSSAARTPIPDTTAMVPGGRCQYVYSGAHAPLERRGQRCEIRTWDGSAEWCWHHDPIPVRRRKAPLRRAVAAQ